LARRPPFRAAVAGRAARTRGSVSADIVGRIEPRIRIERNIVGSVGAVAVSLRNIAIRIGDAYVASPCTVVTRGHVGRGTNITFIERIARQVR
jgi:hypothetical protein